MKLGFTGVAFLISVGLSIAAACPVKSGHVANGQFKDTTGLVPLCSAAFKKIAAEVKPGEYGEFYRTTLDLAGGLKVGKLSQLFSSNGWQKLSVPDNGKVKSFGFKKNGKQSVISVREGSDYVLVFLIGDK